MKTIVKIRFGSHLYGTNTETSDQDFKGCHIPSAMDILLQKVHGEISTERKKSEGERNSPEDIDDKSYALHKYLKLLSEGQTVALDMLFAPDNMLLETSDTWKSIKSNKNKLVTKKSKAFVGYVFQQSAKYGQKGSRLHAAKEAAQFFKDAYEGFGTTAKLHEFMEELKALCGEHTNLIQLPVGNNTDRLEWFFECCQRKICVTNNVKHAYEVFTKIYDNYGHRARLAETNEGVDWKALSHACRVAEEAIELMSTGNITFPLANATHILDIKKGRIPYKEVAEEIEHLLVRVEDASEKSILPDEVDHGFIDDLIAHTYAEEVKKEYAKNAIP